MKKIALMFFAMLLSIASFAENLQATWDATVQGYANAEAVSEATVADGYTITFSKGAGSSNPAWYDNGTAFRIYGNNTFTIQGATNIVAVSVKYVSGSAGNVTASVGTVQQNTADLTWDWTGSSKNIVFTNAQTGQMRITSITITYEEASDEEPGDEPGDEPGQGGETKSVDVQWDPTAQGYADMYKPTSATITEGYTATFSGSGNSTPLYYSGYGGLLFYNSSNVTITGKDITKVVLHVNQDYAGSFTATSTPQGTLNTNATNYTWVGQADAVTLTNGGSSARITGIDITYLVPADEEPGDDEPQYSDDVTTPATPTVTGYTNSLSGTFVTVTIPTEDINAVALNPAKVYYQILKDIEQEVSPVTIAEVGDTELENPITEDLVTIPLGYTDYYVESTGDNARKIYLDNATDILNYNKIGVQTIYRGETELKSEIAWYDIKDYASTEPEPEPEPVVLTAVSDYTWKFDTEDWGGSSSLSITETTIIENIEVVATSSSKIDVENNNKTIDDIAFTRRLKFGGSGSATARHLHLKVAPNSTITVYGVSGSSSAERTLNLSVGAFGQDVTALITTDGTAISGSYDYEGEEDGDIYLYSANSGFNIYGIKVEPKAEEPGTEPEPVEEDVLVEVPATATIQSDWTLSGVFYNGNQYNESIPVQVAFDGQDVYIQGLAYWFEDAWVKGTLNGTTLTIPTGQFVGADEYGNEYVIGISALTSDDEGNFPLTDIVFEYDADAKKFTQVTPYIGESGDKNGKAEEVYNVWFNLTIYQGEPEVASVVELPDGVVPEDYYFTATETYYNEELEYPVQVAIVDDTIYLNGISTSAPDAWIVGTISGNQVTFKANQLLGEVYMGANYGSDDLYFNPDADVVFTYDPATGTLTSADGYITVWGQYAFDEIGDITITKLVAKPATPATPEIVEVKLDDTYPYIEVTIPHVSTEGEPLAASNLTYVILVKDAEGNITELTYTTDLYYYLDGALTQIPYYFTDEYDFEKYLDGRRIYLNQDDETIESWANIGVKSIYTVNGVAYESETVWYLEEEEPVVDGITNIDAIENGIEKVYDLQGRETTKTAKGIKIIRIHTADGTVKTVKAVR